MTVELLQQVRAIDPISGMDRVADVLIEQGMISAIANPIADYPSDARVQDCRGLVLGPGLIDLYSHSGEPGFEDRETLDSLRQAAVAGGFTQVAILPETVPAIDNPAVVTWWHRQQVSLEAAAIHEHSATDSVAQPTSQDQLAKLHCWAALTVDVQGQQMTELAELASTEIVGFADGRPFSNGPLLRRLLEYLHPLGKPIALWACDLSLTGNGVMREGQECLQFGLPGVPAIAETAALAALLEYVAATGTPVHLMRISTARGVELIRTAKARGLPITASTTWMHLLLNSQAVGNYDPSLRLNPPLGNVEDQRALIQGLQEGTLDAIAIDHTPYTYEEKTVAFGEAPAGAIGLEIALPLLWQNFVETNLWSALDLWRYLSSQPAGCLQKQPPMLAVGQPAELTLLDPQQSWIVERRSLRSLATNTPWLGQRLTSRVVQTWCPQR